MKWWQEYITAKYLDNRYKNWLDKFDSWDDLIKDDKVLLFALNTDLRHYSFAQFVKAAYNYKIKTNKFNYNYC